MANSLQANLSNPVAGLGTFSYTVVTTGNYTIRIKSTIPQGSALDIKIKQNSTILVENGGLSTDPTPTQPMEGASTNALFTAGDVINVVFASANAVDSLPNAVKSIVDIYQGF